MRRRVSTENMKVTSEGIEFSFDYLEEAQSLYQECLEKMTDAEIDGNKVTLLIPSREYRSKQENLA